MKTCFKCNKEKPISEFYKHPRMADGYLNKCIECTKKDVSERAYGLSNDPNWLIRERARGREKFHRLYSPYKDRPKPLPMTEEQKIKKRKEYSERYPERKSETIKQYYRKYPERKVAKNITSIAIRDKKLTKQPCEICGEVEVQAHHEDYSKPLEVRWLCIKHHNEHHVKLREQKLLERFDAIN